MTYSVTDTTFQGERAIELSAGDYRAVILPDIGANLISFRDVKKNYTFLREPSSEEMDAFKKRPTNHGVPFLFPPNRFDNGSFTVGSRTYQFPVNEVERNNHIHGFMYNHAFEVVSQGENSNGAFVVLAANMEEGHHAFDVFPHVFCITVEYTLSETKLSHCVTVQNMGDEPMPCMLGFHTAVNAPFAPDSSPEDCKFTATVGHRWELDDRMLPTGQTLPLSEEEQKFVGEGAYPYFAELDNHYSAKPVDGRNVAKIKDSKAGATFVYDVGVRYRNWMIWNQFAGGKFICPEPQINLVNAPNSSLPVEETGLVVLGKEELWTETSHMYVE